MWGESTLNLNCPTDAWTACTVAVAVVVFSGSEMKPGLDENGKWTGGG